MVAEVDSGRVAFALAQTILTMLVGSKILDPDLLRTTADGLGGDRRLGIPENEVAILTAAIRLAATP
jgi:hypothetical protein